MGKSPRIAPLSVVTLLVIVLLASACSPAPTIVPVSQPTAVPSTATQEAAPSATPLPSATPTQPPTLTPTAVPPTQTPQPTATPALALTGEGLSGWCLPENTLLTAASDPLSPAETAELSKMVDGALEIRNLPWSGCVFTYAFNQPAPEGLKLEVYEVGGKSPWLTADLHPVDGKPEVVSTLLTHSFIIAPPFWHISYEFALKDASGQELARTPVNLHRWETKLCFNGQPPNYKTLRCPLWQDLHPWDAGYGEIIPTYTPEADD